MNIVPTEYPRLLSEDHNLSFLLPEEKEHLLKRGHLAALTPRREVEEIRKLVRVILDKQTGVDVKQRLASLSFILTYNCNLSCSYCYQGVPGLKNLRAFPR